MASTRVPAEVWAAIQDWFTAIGIAKPEAMRALLQRAGVSAAELAISPAVSGLRAVRVLDGWRGDRLETLQARLSGGERLSVDEEEEMIRLCKEHISAVRGMGDAA